MPLQNKSMIWLKTLIVNEWYKILSIDPSDGDS
jgi:hypothetical protein